MFRRVSELSLEQRLPVESQYGEDMGVEANQDADGVKVPLGARIATWNCRMGLHAKQAAIDELACDLLVLQECAESDLAKFAQFRFKGPSKKGLAVVAFNGWQLHESPDDPDFSNMVFVKVLDSLGRHVLDLAGVWALTGAPLKYHEQFTKILEFLGGRDTNVPVVLAGDLNASAQGPRIPEHAENVRLAERIGLVSLYHEVNGIDHGSEPEMTLRWIGRGGEEFGYHCDFIFASVDLAEAVGAVQVGEWERWVESGRSDHAPVLAELWRPSANASP